MGQREPKGSPKGTQDDQKWEAAIAKWQALAEEAGPEHSKLAKLLVDTNGAQAAVTRMDEQAKKGL